MSWRQPRLVSGLTPPAFLGAHSRPGFNHQLALESSRRPTRPHYRPYHTPAPQSQTSSHEPPNKRRRVQSALSAKRTSPANNSNWQLTVGLEIHAELNTARKLFSRARTSYNAPPNTNVAPFDLAFPGAQPEFQRETLLPALRAALALGCEVQGRSSWDRKHYFYRDQPAGYQITQYYRPFAKSGKVTLFGHDGIAAEEEGDAVTVGIKQVQMEQDTAKTLQQSSSTHLLDFNRVSHPLIEIITLPQIHHPATAAACVRKIQAMLMAVDAVTAGMEVGGLRVDVNVSVRRRGQENGAGPDLSYGGVSGLGQRTEIKNLVSYKAVEDAIVAERDRQIELLERGERVVGETRGWSLGSTETRSLRGKEGEVDYRYMPDPDLGPLIIGDDLVRHLRDTLPQLPDQLVSTLTQSPEYGLPEKDARIRVAFDDGDQLDYFMEAVHQARGQLGEKDPLLAKVGSATSNLLNEISGLLKLAGQPWTASVIAADELASLVLYKLQRRITGPALKNLLSLRLVENDIRPVTQIIEEEELELKPMSEEEYHDIVSAILAENEKEVNFIRQSLSKSDGPDHEKLETKVKKSGSKKAEGKIMYLVGEVIKRGQDGRVEPQKAREHVRRALEIDV